MQYRVPRKPTYFLPGRPTYVQLGHIFLGPGSFIRYDSSAEKIFEDNARGLALGRDCLAKTDPRHVSHVD